MAFLQSFFGDLLGVLTSLEPSLTSFLKYGIHDAMRDFVSFVLQKSISTVLQFFFEIAPFVYNLVNYVDP